MVKMMSEGVRTFSSAGKLIQVILSWLFVDPLHSTWEASERSCLKKVEHLSGYNRCFEKHYFYLVPMKVGAPGGAIDSNLEQPLGRTVASHHHRPSNNTARTPTGKSVWGI